METYPVSGYYYLVHLYFCLAELNKNTFLFNLNQLLADNRNKKIKAPVGDLPLNNDLVSLPSYTQFIYDNRDYLE